MEKEFIKERDYILANFENLSIDEIKSYCNRWEIPIPNDEMSIIGGLHKARLNVTELNRVNDEQLFRLQLRSKKWLNRMGWK